MPASSAFRLFVLVLLTASLWAASNQKPTCADTREYDFKWHETLEPSWYAPTPGVVQAARQEALGQVEEVVFCARANGRDWHWYANFGYVIEQPDSYKYGGEGGRLMALDLASGAVRVLLDDPMGDIRDPAVSYDGKRIVFAWRKGGEHQFHLYIISADGSDLHQITDGAYDDFEPTWLPDGGIMFVSSRCMRWVPCWYTQVAILFRCEADGSDVKQISFGVENENTPWPLSNGRVLYTRWEYVDRSQLKYHGLWSKDPDGTGQALVYDNLGTMNLYIGAKPIPGHDGILTVIAPKHGRNEQRGRLAILDRSYGPENPAAITWLDRGYPCPDGKGPKKKRRHVPDESWRDPYPLSRDCLLAASLRDLVVMNGDGDYEVLYSLPQDAPATWNLHEPRPLVARQREPVIPQVQDPGDGMATITVMDVYEGRGMEAVEPGNIKELLVMEEMPRPVSKCAYADAMSSRSNYVLHRILGRAPVEADGSAHFKVPAGRPIFLYALDQRSIAAKTMASFFSAMPGEVVGCVGCHEERGMTPARYAGKSLQAMQRPPSMLQRFEGVPELFDYVRDVQPILDRHCVACHNYEKHAGKLLLTGDMTVGYSVSYTHLQQPGYGPLGDRKSQPLAQTGDTLQAYATASGNSKLINTLMAGHKKVQLSELEMEILKRWIDAGTTFAGSYAALGSVSRDNKIDKIAKQAPKAAAVLDRRCISCHDNRGGYWIEGELRKAGWRFNVSDPSRSLLLLAPLAKQAGGLEICQAGMDGGPSTPIFSSRKDGDFLALRGLVDQVVAEFGQPRWFQEGFRYQDFYIREMRRFGALAPDEDPYQLDPWTIDRRYFEQVYAVGPGPAW